MQMGDPVVDLVTPYTKIEKVKASNYKAPRMIQGRDVTFNIEYAKFIKPLEDKITKTGHKAIHFGKGDYDEIGRRVFKLPREYKYYTKADHKTFDACVTREHLRLTHKFYLAC